MLHILAILAFILILVVLILIVSECSNDLERWFHREVAHIEHQETNARHIRHLAKHGMTSSNDDDNDETPQVEIPSKMLAPMPELNSVKKQNPNIFEVRMNRL